MNKKKKVIKSIKDYQKLLQFICVNGHNLLIDAYIPGERIKEAQAFMEKCKEISKQLEDIDNE